MGSPKKSGSPASSVTAFWTQRKTGASCHLRPMRDIRNHRSIFRHARQILGHHRHRVPVVHAGNITAGER